MAIVNLAGNVQPTSVSSGNILPKTPSRAPSASNSLENSNIVANELKQGPETTSAKAEKVEVADIQRIEVESQIEELQQFNQHIDRSLQFKVDEELGVTIVRVIDKRTDELIRQFPPEELLNLSRRLKELNEQNSSHSGLLLQEKV